MPDNENEELGGLGADPEISILQPFVSDLIRADGSLSLPTDPPAQIIVVRGTRLPRPWGGMSSMPIMIQVAGPAELAAVASISPEPGTDICSQYPHAHGRQIIITFNPDGSGHYIAPPNFNMQQMLRTAQNLRSEFETMRSAGSTGLIASAFLLGQFANMVRPGGDYDWKESGANDLAIPIPGAPARSDGTYPEMSIYEPFGNWAYGFFGAALGLSDSTLLGGAHLAQLVSSRHLDDPRDQANAAAGAAAFRGQHQNATNGEDDHDLLTGFTGIIQC